VTPRSARPAGGSPATAAPAADEVADRLHSAAIHLLRWLRREDERGALSGPRLSALSVIVFGGPVTLGELAAAEQVRPPTMTRIVDALEAAGLATRRPDPADARAVLIAATRTGRRLLAEGRRRRVEALAERLRGLNDDERAALHAAAPALVRLSGAPFSG